MSKQVEGIQRQKVTGWLAGHVPGLVPPVSYSLIVGGHSNLTYRCEDSAGNACVLRRPPLGHILQSAHDMSREHRIIEALKDSPVPVPGNFGLCQDKSINGADFYVMEFVDGTVMNDSVLGGSVSLASRRAIGLHLVDILARLHAINPDDVGLGDLGRKEAYLARQLKRWSGQWTASKTHEIPEMEASCRLLTERMPVQAGASIVHGDYRLGNMIVGEGHGEGQPPGEVRAILDWELCTLGDPLADLGYLLNNCVSPDEVEEPGEGDGAPTGAGGFPDRDEICAIYTDRTGRDLSGIKYYRAFSHWRLAAIGQGVYKRYLVGAMGEAKDVDLERQKESVVKRAREALALLTT